MPCYSLERRGGSRKEEVKICCYLTYLLILSCSYMPASETFQNVGGTGASFLSHFMLYADINMNIALTGHFAWLTLQNSCSFNQSPSEPLSFFSKATTRSWLSPDIGTCATSAGYHYIYSEVMRQSRLGAVMLRQSLNAWQAMTLPRICFQEINWNKNVENAKRKMKY